MDAYIGAEIISLPQNHYVGWQILGPLHDKVEVNIEDYDSLSYENIRKCEAATKNAIKRNVNKIIEMMPKPELCATGNVNKALHRTSR